MVGESPVLLSPSVPHHVGAIHIAALFSHTRLTVPPAFLKFFHLDRAPRSEDHFCAPTILSSDFYVDIDGTDDARVLYHRNGFRLSTNDLVPLFDNETFEITSKVDVQLLRRYSLTQSRTLDRDTVIHVCSREARPVRLAFTYTPPAEEVPVSLVVGPALDALRIVFTKEGDLTSWPFALARGVNRIELKPESPGGRVEILGMSLRRG